VISGILHVSVAQFFFNNFFSKTAETIFFNKIISEIGICQPGYLVIYTNSYWTWHCCSCKRVLNLGSCLWLRCNAESTHDHIVVQNCHICGTSFCRIYTFIVGSLVHASPLPQYLLRIDTWIPVDCQNFSSWKILESQPWFRHLLHLAAVSCSSGFWRVRRQAFYTSSFHDGGTDGIYSL
jgi:hypothetical protein